MSVTADEPTPATIDCALCVVGAGLAGMNALAVASRYLPTGTRVALVDARPRCGGMWTDTYDYVRLHQPHPMFTAGDIRWQTQAPPWHLASKPEVLAHFEHCLNELRRRLTIVELFNHAYEMHDEHADGVDVHLRDSAGDAVRVRTRHCIKAFGFRVPQNPPLALSSRRVHSFSPEDSALLDASAADAEKPVWIIGGGKTGMDTAQALLRQFPSRPVHLAVGRGTVFMNRDRSFPRGWSRWWRGQPSIATFTDLARRFDGDNEAEVFDYFKRTYAVQVGERHAYYALGLQSEDENEFLAQRLASVRNGYLQDAKDTDTGVALCFDDGQREHVPVGSTIVNCTGYVMREAHAYEPYVSDGGAVVSIQPSSAINILTSFGAYYLTHLLYLGRLRTLPLYALDHEAMAQRNKQGLMFACAAQLILNLYLLADALPVSAFKECGLDFNRWMPFPRRLLALMRVRRERATLEPHCRQALDRYRARFDVHGGVLV